MSSWLVVCSCYNACVNLEHRTIEFCADIISLIIVYVFDKFARPYQFAYTGMDERNTHFYMFTAV